MKKFSSVLSLVNSIWFLVAAVAFYLNLFIYANSGKADNGEGLAIAIILIVTLIGIPFIAAFGITGIVLSSICLNKKELSVKSFRIMSIVLIVLDIIQAVAYGFIVFDPGMWKISYSAITSTFIVSIALALTCVVLKIIDLIKSNKTIKVTDNN